VRLAALGAVGLLGAAVLVGVLARKDKTDPSLAMPMPMAEPTIRRVIVPLPFAAKHVTFDEQSRDLAPPADVAAFEVPRESGARHRITALAVDGSKAEAYVRESEGVARPEGPGFTIEPLETYAEETTTTPTGTTAGNLIELPPTPNGVKRVLKRPPPGKGAKKDAGAPAASASAQAPKPIGTVKDGFTKLR